MVSHLRTLISRQAQHVRWHPQAFLYSAVCISQCVIDGIMAQGHGMLTAKFDVASAYRNVVIHPDNCPLLGMQWHG